MWNWLLNNKNQHFILMKNRIISSELLLLLVFFIGHIPTAMGNYDPSATVYRFQKEMAQRGNASSQFKLGLMYETGAGINASLVQAITWYKKSADQLHKPAINRLTYLEIKRTGFKDKDQAWLKELTKDAKFNEGEALFLLGQMYREGTGVDKNLNLALKLLRKAIAANIPGSEVELAHIEDEILAQKKRIATKNISKKSPLKTIKKSTKITSPVHKKYTPKTKLKIHKKPPIIAPKINNNLKKITRSKPQVKTNKPIDTQQKHLKTTSPIKPLKSHPMDSICGGNNRYRRECR